VKGVCSQVFVDVFLQNHPFLEATYNRESLNGTHFSGIKNCKSMVILKDILPGKLACPLKINDWKMYFLLK